VTTPLPGAGRNETAERLETLTGRMLIAGTWVAMTLVLAGVALALATGVDLLSHGGIPPFSFTAIPGDLVALRPEGFLWAGIVLIVALPVGRVVVAGLGFLAARDGRLTLVSLLVLIVVLVSVLAALGLPG
jgi:uncharacterized membrane protein